MPNRAVQSIAIALALVSFAYPARPQAFTVLQHFPIATGSFECTLSEVAPDLLVGIFDTTPGEIFGLSGNGRFAVVAALSQTVEGNLPKGPLFAGSGGYIYGSTDSFGTNPRSLGVLFRLGAHAALSVVSNQISLSSPVIEGTDGNLYGTGLNWASSYGLYKVSRSGQSLAFYPFEASVNPISVSITGPVTQASDGNFYGEASLYPESPFIFKVTPAGDFTPIYQAANFAPVGGLVEGPNGLLYGISGDTVFSVNTSGQLHTIYTFGTASSLPQAGLTVASDGNLHGTASWIFGGIGNGPAGVFRLSLDGSVGVGALDMAGNLAAGTSTGGTVLKMPGRVGDSPIIGLRLRQ
jgi:hypothetical protein